MTMVLHCRTAAIGAVVVVFVFGKNLVPAQVITATTITSATTASTSSATRSGDSSNDHTVPLHLNYVPRDLFLDEYTGKAYMKHPAHKISTTSSSSSSATNVNNNNNIKQGTNHHAVYQFKPYHAASSTTTTVVPPPTGPPQPNKDTTQSGHGPHHQQRQLTRRRRVSSSSSSHLEPTTTTADDELDEDILYQSQEQQYEAHHRLLSNSSSTNKQDNAGAGVVVAGFPPVITILEPSNHAIIPSTAFTIRATIVSDNSNHIQSAYVTLMDTSTNNSGGGGGDDAYELDMINTDPNENIWESYISLANVVVVDDTAAITAIVWKYFITTQDVAHNTAVSSRMRVTTMSQSESAGGGDHLNGSAVVVPLAHWDNRAAPLWAATGRLLFQMPSSVKNRGGTNTTTNNNNNHQQWQGYRCTGTLIQSPAGSGRSMVFSAGHCVYDDIHKQFARNVLFVPGQDDDGTDVSDRDCTNDALGCIHLEYGFVSSQFADSVFPSNSGTDYGIYVSSTTMTSEPAYKTIGLNGDIVPMVLNLDPPSSSSSSSTTTTASGNWTYAFGYAVDQDPNLMYSYDQLTFLRDYLVDEATGHVIMDSFLPNSALTVGSSGGAFTTQNPRTTDDGNDDGVVRVFGALSWLYTDRPGVGASPLYTGGMRCVLDAASKTALGSISLLQDRGLVVACPV